MTISIDFPIEPPGINAAGMGALLFVPAIKDIRNPTITELRAGENISCKLYGWNPKGEQGKVSRSRYCSPAENEDLGRVKYSVDDIEYDYDPQNPTTATGDYSLYPRMVEGTSGYVVDRRGIGSREAFAEGQYVTVWPVKLGVRNEQPITTEDGKTLSVTQAVAITSDPAKNVKIAPAAV